ncbi:MAG TPA: hypothetical protein VKR62_04355, partial [Roseiarcus sp.]|nr:hypothetical protein [Roseiarcus sp.]
MGAVDPFLGFSWDLAVLPRRPPLMSLGLSWISLDSLVRIETFQWVMRIFAGRNFLALSGGAELSRAGAPSLRRYAEAQDWTWGKLSRISDFPQEFVGP